MIDFVGGKMFRIRLRGYVSVATRTRALSYITGIKRWGNLGQKKGHPKGWPSHTSLANYILAV